MPDQIFENDRLVAIYDDLDGERRDLEHYLAIARELGAKSVLDIGSGTGCFALLLAGAGFSVTGLEPARASLNFARAKPGAEKVKWLLGDTGSLPALAVDLAVMTGNVAQVFESDEAWDANLASIRRALRPGGHLVFEVRDPARQAWLEWTKEKTLNHQLTRAGGVASWCEVTKVSGEFVSFRWTYRFDSDGAELTSDSTLRFRSREAIARSLEKAGFRMSEVREAPDRPGKEFVFFAHSS